MGSAELRTTAWEDFASLCQVLLHLRAGRSDQNTREERGNLCLRAIFAWVVGVYWGDFGVGAEVEMDVLLLVRPKWGICARGVFSCGW